MADKYFEKLEIWQEARRLANSIYEITRSEGFSKDAVLLSNLSPSA